MAKPKSSSKEDRTREKKLGGELIQRGKTRTATRKWHFSGGCRGEVGATMRWVGILRGRERGKRGGRAIGWGEASPERV